MKLFFFLISGMPILVTVLPKFVAEVLITEMRIYALTFNPKCPGSGGLI